jgi:hypothetical protein
MESEFKPGDYAIVIKDAYDFFEKGEQVIVVSQIIDNGCAIGYNCTRKNKSEEKVMLPYELRKLEFTDIVKQILKKKIMTKKKDEFQVGYWAEVIGSGHGTHHSYAIGDIVELTILNGNTSVQSWRCTPVKCKQDHDDTYMQWIDMPDLNPHEFRCSVHNILLKKNGTQKGS